MKKRTKRKLALLAGKLYRPVFALIAIISLIAPSLFMPNTTFAKTLNTNLTANSASAASGSTVNLTATLTDDSSNPISGETITFSATVKVSGSHQALCTSCTATTDSSGVATLPVTLTGVDAGTYKITASFAGDSTYKQSSDNLHDLTVTAAKSNQTITFNSLSAKTYGDADFTVSATATSGLTVTFTATSGQCTISSTTVHITGAGSCTITASQSGNSTYNAATDVPQTFTINKAAQTITFTQPSDTITGNSVGLVATSTSGLTVSFAATAADAGICTVSGTSAQASAVGTCVVAATQTGDTNYNAATEVDKSFNITASTPGKTNQTITFNALADKTYGDADFSVIATASSGLTVSFAASGNCTISGTTVHITGAGTCTITASQAGDSTFNPASDVPQTFNINKAAQTITFTQPADTTTGNSISLSATSTSGLTVSFAATAADTGICTVSGTTAQTSAVGTCVVAATQTGDNNYNAATEVDKSFTITAPPAGTVSVTGVTLNEHTATLNVGNTDQLTATITPNNATDQTVSWQSSDTSVATVSNTGLVTAISTGTATITVTTTDGGFTDTDKITTFIPPTGPTAGSGSSNTSNGSGTTPTTPVTPQVLGATTPPSNTPVTPQVLGAATIADGSLVKNEAEKTVYLIVKGLRKAFSSAQEFFSYGFGFNKVNTNNTVNEVQGSTIIPAMDGTVAVDLNPRGANGKVVIYFLSGGVKRPFASYSTFLGLGYKPGQVVQFSLAGYTMGSPITSTTDAHPDGALVKNNSQVYWIRGGMRNPFPSVQVLNTYGLSLKSMIPAANAADMALPIGPDLQPRDTMLQQ